MSDSNVPHCPKFWGLFAARPASWRGLTIGSKPRVADGFHRVPAAIAAGVESLPCEVHEGGRSDCLAHAVGANLGHTGIRYTTADKQRAVGLALTDPELSGRSDHEIAFLCGVSHMSVGRARKASINWHFVPVDEPAKRVGADGVARGERRSFSNDRDAALRLLADPANDKVSAEKIGDRCDCSAQTIRDLRKAIKAGDVKLLPLDTVDLPDDAIAPAEGEACDSQLEGKGDAFEGPAGESPAPLKPTIAESTAGPATVDRVAGAKPGPIEPKAETRRTGEDQISRADGGAKAPSALTAPQDASGWSLGRIWNTR